MVTKIHSEFRTKAAKAKNTRNQLVTFVICMVLIFGVTGCSSFANQSSRKASGTPAKASPIKLKSASDYVAIPNRSKTRPLNLEKAKADLKKARRKVQLAELKMELSVLEMKLADYNQKIAETMVRKAEILKQRQRLQADYPKGRGIKAAVIDKLKTLKTRSLDLESENIKSRAAMAKIDLNIQKLKRKVRFQINN
jgi:hypothetical protein